MNEARTQWENGDRMITGDRDADVALLELTRIVQQIHTRRRSDLRNDIEGIVQ